MNDLVNGKIAVLIMHFTNGKLPQGKIFVNYGNNKTRTKPSDATLASSRIMLLCQKNKQTINLVPVKHAKYKI